jgi:hypothetical protein
MNQADAVDRGACLLKNCPQRVVAALLFTAVAVALLRYPLAQIPLTLGLLIYAALLYRKPAAWLIAVPALLPVFDLAPWSGWFFFDELDFVVFVTLAVGLWRHAVPSMAVPSTPRLFSFAITLLVVSYGVSLMIGLLPLESWDANAFSNYYSRYNSLRMSKGFFEGLALFFLFLRQRPEQTEATWHLIIGMILGVVGTIMAVVWERLRFSGLWEFAGDFRVTAVFSGLHNGGNDLEAYLVLAQPFVVALMVFYRNWVTSISGVALILLSAYSLFVTFSRAGLIAIVVNGVVLALGLVVSLRHRAVLLNVRALLTGTVLVTVVLVLASFVVGGRYFQSRLDRAKKDWDFRMLQSRKTVEMMNPDSMTTWFGMGLGRYPAAVYQRNPLNNRAAAYRFETEGENLFVRLFPGNPLYFGQWINGIKPLERYRLLFAVRPHGNGSLTAYICEKTLQYSFRCASQKFDLETSDSWTEQTAVIDVQSVGSKGASDSWLSVRPVEFALANGSKDAVFDVDNIRLLDSAGNDLLANGSFLNGSDRWFFTVDDHTPWQNWNHWVHLFFEQGWLGVLSFVFFSAYIFGRLVKQIVHGNWLAGIALAAVSSFLSVGIFGYLFDTPRMALIYFLIALIFGRGLHAPVGRDSAEPIA